MIPATLKCNADADGSLLIEFAGDWLLAADLPAPDPVFDELRRTPPVSVKFSTTGLGDWDTGLITTLIAIRRSAEAQAVPLNEQGLPPGAQRLMAMALTVKERKGARRNSLEKGALEQLGEMVLDAVQSTRELLAFTGKFVLSIRRFLRGEATYLGSDFVQHIQEAGVEALPIVSLIGFLMGMIFAFVGVMQLELFGAGIYTANLVAVAMVREMSPIMTAIIIAGRTGAAYAAQIGTMKVNEEVDALTTLGINPMDFLVTPRVLALILMAPLLTTYASLMGILGGAAVALVMLDVSLVQYVEQTITAVGLNSLLGGLFKCIVYATLVGLAGCEQGIACGGSAMAVGQATTKAVVMGIVMIVVSASVLTVIYINLGI